MRKVFIKVFLTFCFLLGLFFPIANNAVASETTTFEFVNSEEFTYEKVWVDGILFWFVYDESGKVIDIFPDSCGCPHGGN